MVAKNITGDGGYIDTGPGPDNTQQWVVLIALFTLALPGLLGNVCVIVTVYKSRKLKNVTFVKMASLSASDCINNLFYWLVGTLTILNPRPELAAHAFWRHPALGAILIISWFSTQFHMDLIAVDRYVAVIHWTHYKRLFTIKTTYIAIGLIWFTCLVLSIPFFAQHALYVYNRHFDTFIYDVSAPGTRSFSIFSLCCSALSPLLMIFCSVRIILRLREQQRIRRAYKAASGMPGAKPDVHVMRREDVRLTIQFLLIFLAFTTATFLFNLSLILHAQDMNCSALDLSVNIFHLLHFSINPLLYFIFSERLRSEFLSLVSCRRLAGFLGSTSLDRSQVVVTPAASPGLSRHHRLMAPHLQTPVSLSTSLASLASNRSSPPLQGSPRVQGGSPRLQGGSPRVQGGSPRVQGGSPKVQSSLAIHSGDAQTTTAL